MTAEAVRADLSDPTAYTAHAPRECLNGCESLQGDARSKVFCEPGHLLCPKCADRAETWLRGLPDLYALLPHVVDHGTVPADPGTTHTKRPDPPAPMRLDVIDLLDTRAGFGVLGVVHSWADLVRDERQLTMPCTCNHDKLGHVTSTITDWCIVTDCACDGYRARPATVTGECGLLIQHLAWAIKQGFVGDLYAEIKQLHRTLADTVGEYRRKPVGKCAAFVDVAIGQINDPATTQVLCGGALVMETEGTAVRCLSCGTRHEANQGLRELGLIVGRIFGDTETSQLEAS